MNYKVLIQNDLKKYETNGTYTYIKPYDEYLKIAFEELENFKYNNDIELELIFDHHNLSFYLFDKTNNNLHIEIFLDDLKSKMASITEKIRENKTKN